MRVSIIIESDNLMFSDPDLFRRMLETVESQVREMPRHLELGQAPPLPADLPVEVLVIAAADLEQSEADSVEIEGLFDLPAESSDVLTVRRLVTTGVRYFEQKNLGVERATGDVLVFLDSDVVPEEGWLRELLRPFADPGISVVAGNTYVGLDGPYSRAMALAWFFDLRAPDGPLETTDRFYANNVAFRKSFIDRFRFEIVPGTSRGASIDLARRILKAGLQIHAQPVARVSHPPPNGARHFVRRALAQGRDNVLLVRTSNRLKRAWQALWHFQLWVRHSWRKIMHDRERVALPVWQVPLAIGIAVSYYAVAFAGGIAATLFPGYLSRQIYI